MKQFLHYLNSLTKHSLLPTIILATLLAFTLSSNLAITLLYFSIVFAVSHALHLTLAYRNSDPQKISGNAMKAVAAKFLMILVASGIYLVLMEMENLGLVIVVLLYIYYMAVSAKYYYQN